MANRTSTGKGRARRWLVMTTLVPVSAIALLCVALTANAAEQVPAHGSALIQNSCSGTYDPPVSLPFDTTVPVTISTDASPEPHNGSPIMLTNTQASVEVPGALVQGLVDDGHLGEGSAIPTTVS